MAHRLRGKQLFFHSPFSSYSSKTRKTQPYQTKSISNKINDEKMIALSELIKLTELIELTELIDLTELIEFSELYD